MRNIENHINNVFDQLPNTQEVHDTRQELLIDSKEKYNDLIENGMSQEDAEKEVIKGIGTVSDWRQAFPGGPSEAYVPYKTKNNTTRNVLLVVLAVILVPSLIIGALSLNNAFFRVKDSESESGTDNHIKEPTGDNEDTNNEVLHVEGLYSDIKIESVAYDVQVSIKSSEEDISASLDSTIKDELVFTKKGNELKISTKYEEQNKGINLKSYSGKILVTIPEGMLKELEVDTVSGDIDISGSETSSALDELSIETVSGYTVVSGLNVRDLSVDTVSANIVLSGVTITEEISVDSVSGDTTIMVNESHPDFIIKKDSISGSAYDERTTKGQGSVKLDFDSISGDLTIKDID